MRRGARAVSMNGLWESDDLDVRERKGWGEDGERGLESLTLTCKKKEKLKEESRETDRQGGKESKGGRQGWTLHGQEGLSDDSMSVG